MMSIADFVYIVNKNFFYIKYKNTVYLNMEDSGGATAIFERDLKPERIVKELSALSGQSIFPDDTLVI